MPKKTTQKKNKVLEISGKAPVIDIILTFQNLSIMLKTGLPIEDALEVVASQAQSKVLKNCYLKIIQDINSGLTLAESMKKYPKVFNSFIVSIINAGEQGGNLETNLSYLADYLKKNYLLVKKIKASLFYPVLILCLTFFEVIGVIFFVLPQLDVFFSSLKTSSFITTVVLNFGRFVRGNALILFLIMLTLGIGVAIFFKTSTGRYVKDYILLHTPIIRRLVKGMILANFSRTFGTLLASGIPLYSALILSKETLNNQIYEKIIEDTQKKVLGGLALSESLKGSDYFPTIFTKMLEVGEKAGALETNLMSMHQYYAEEVEDLSGNIAALIEPIMLIFVGLIVAILAISIIVPLYSVVNSLNA